jgi:hypothetical protein
MTDDHVDLRKATLQVAVTEHDPEEMKRRRNRKTKGKMAVIPNPIFREVVTVAGFRKIVQEMITTDLEKFPDDMPWAEAAEILHHEAGFADDVRLDIAIVAPRRLRKKILHPNTLLGVIRSSRWEQ